MPRIIQFFHPGGEHGHDKNSPNLKSWNTGPHQRKFVAAKGDFLTKENNFVKNENILLWTEWEPNSQVKEFRYRDNLKFPEFLHIPYIPKVLPQPNPNNDQCRNHWQNTDPFIFWNNFKYAICRQGKKYSDFRICDLEAGTIIVFGSIYKEDGSFKSIMIDTVFIVSKDYIDKQKLLSLEYEKLSDDDKKYFNVSFRMAFPRNEDYPYSNRIYTGVRYEEREQYNGLFSFVPSMYTSTTTPEKGFSRIEMPLFTETEQAQTPFMVKKVSEEECIQYWTEIKDKSLSLKNACIATRINMPKMEDEL